MGDYITVNGVKREFEAPMAETTLLRFLRDILKIKDVKCGCNKGFCGSCTVIVNGLNKKSCALKLKNISGAGVTTAGYINSAGLSRYSKLLDRGGAVQCGFCFPGIVCSLESKLGGVENPSRKQIVEALSGHVCRCTGYIPIIECASGKNPSGIDGLLGPEGPVGSSPTRSDSAPKLSGNAVFADDIDEPGMLHVAVIRSAHAHARIVSVDATDAGRAEGVARVITHADLPGEKNFGVIRHDQPVLCSDRVRFRGDAIAVVVATDRALAEKAGALIKVEYEPLKPVFSVQDAISSDAPPINGTANVCCEVRIKSEEAGGGHFGESGVSVSGSFSIGPVEHAYMEPECSVARFDEKSGKIRVSAGSQNIHSDRSEIAAILGIGEECVDVDFVYTGGGFGGKEDLTTQPYSALAAYFTKKTCKYLFTREESLLCSTKKHPFAIKIEISADREGNFDAITVDAVSDVGPYASLSEIVITRFATHVMGPYSWKAHDIRATGIHTNNLIAGAMRGFGVNQACFALETMIDRLADKLGISPETLRRINMVVDGKRMGLGETAAGTAGLKKALDAVMSRVKPDEIEEYNASAPAGKKRVFGIALAHKNISLGNNSPRDHSSATIAIVPGTSKLIVRSGASDIGQGVYNILRQIASAVSGIRFEDVSICVPGTDDCPPAGVTSASRQTFMSGNAVKKAVGEYFRKLKSRIGEKLGLGDEEFKIEGDRIVYTNENRYQGASTIWDFVTNYEKIEFASSSRYDAPATMESKNAGADGFRSHFGYSFAAHAAIVEIDELERKFRVIRIIAAHDVGRAINPVALRGQIIGGVVMGLGYAVSERLEISEGAPGPKGLAGLGLLKASQIPDIEPVIIEEPLEEAPFGARGIGEISTVPVAAAIANALRSATGLHFESLPISFDANGFRFAS